MQIQEVKINGITANINGFYDRSPKTLGERISRYFQKIEKIEKIAEIADETFHLFHAVFVKYTNPMVYQTLRNLHHGAHDIEHLLHSFCFLGDVSRLMTNTFFQNGDGNQLNALQKASRVCHAISHCFATVQFLKHLELCSFNGHERIFQYANHLSVLGYSLWTISILWERYQGKKNLQFTKDLSIHLGGALFEATHVIDGLKILSPSLEYALSKGRSIAGIIHAQAVVDCLTTKDKEPVRASFSFCTFECSHPKAQSKKNN